MAGSTTIGAVVLERVPGQPDFDGVATHDRDTIVDEYLQLMASVHALDVQQFVDAGIFHPAPGEDPAFVGHLRLERQWRAKKRYPNPFMEFCLGWLHRHPPRSNGRMTPIIWDTGQFHHVDGHLVAALDLEFGSVGDPMLDLALWRMRDTLIPFGDFATPCIAATRRSPARPSTSRRSSGITSPGRWRTSSSSARLSSTPTTTPTS